MCTLQWQFPSLPSTHNHSISQIQETYKEKWETLLMISLFEVFHKKLMGTFMTSWNFWAVFIRTPLHIFTETWLVFSTFLLHQALCLCWELYTAELCNINASIYRRSFVQAAWRWFIWCEEPLYPRPLPPPAAHVAAVTINHSGARRKSTETAIQHLIIQIIRPINIQMLFHRFFLKT